MLEQPRHPERALRQGIEQPEAVCHEWYQNYGKLVYGYLRFHLPSPELAEDLTAEVFLRALKAFPRFDSGSGTPRAWLFRIAQNALRDHHRQAARRPMVSISALWDLECTAPSPEERLLWEEEVGALLGAMTELSAADREIIGLCYGSDLSVTEASDVLGISATAARTRLWRALGRLRKILTK
jgi:RNA polymerase sigma-70 factor (ECF subfamily)